MVWKKKKQKSKSLDDTTKFKAQFDEQHAPHLKSCMKGSDGPSSSDDEGSNDGSTTSQINSLSSRHQSSSTRLSQSSRSVDTQSKTSGAASVLSRPSDRSDGSAVDDEGGKKSHNVIPDEIQDQSTSEQTKGNCFGAKKSVHFSSIQIREFERVVADNPSCTSGPPIGIGWKYGRTHIVDVNSYEVLRSSRSRKKTSQLILSREEREALLLNWGASFNDMIEAVRGNIKVKNQRRQTVVNIGKVERIEEAFESATKRLKRALLMRRSTGDKVKRLQEQANLAQSALKSLKIAEDRALREIRASRMITSQSVEKDDINGFGNQEIDDGTSVYSKAEPVDSRIRSPQRSMGMKQRSEVSSSFDTLDHSTTPSQKELERFHRELELEMFGDEELPSMVGQTLEITLKQGDYLSRMESRLSIGTFNLGESSEKEEGVPTTENESENCGDEIDVDLEKEMDRSMISQSLLDDIELDVDDSVPGSYNILNHRRLPLQSYSVQGDFISSTYQTVSTQTRTHQEGGQFSQSMEVVEYEVTKMRAINHQHSHLAPPVPLPLHAGMSMFENCALLGDQTDLLDHMAPDTFSQTHTDLRRRNRSSPSSSRSRRDANDGPQIFHMPLSSHITPTQWMDEESESTPRNLTGYYDTITISEDSFDRQRHVVRW